MNRIYKSIWNAVTQTFTAVSECQQSRGKKCASKNKLLPKAAILITFMLPGMAALGYESTLVSSETINFADNPFYIGNNQQETILHEDSTNLIYLGGSGIKLNFDFNNPVTPTSEDIGGTVGLLNHAISGYKQVFLTTNDLGTSYALWDDDSDLLDMSDHTSFQQNLSQDGQTVALLTYAIGESAFDLVRENESLFNVSRIDGNLIYFADRPDLGFTTDGIGIIRNPEEGELQGLELLAVLTEINLTQTQNSAGLTLEAKQGESLLVTPVLSGNGNLIYTGAGVFTVDDYLTGGTDDLNTYSGNTYVLGIDSENRLTLNLQKQQSLGKTQFLFAQNALINVAGGKETVNGDAEFQNTQLLTRQLNS